MDQEKILARLALYRGLTTEEAAQYASLAEEAADWLGQQVRGDVPGGDGLLENAAAAWINWQFALLDSDEDFTAGDVRLAGGSRAQGARALWENARSAAAPYLRENGFEFRRVP